FMFRSFTFLSLMVLSFSEVFANWSSTSEGGFRSPRTTRKEQKIYVDLKDLISDERGFWFRSTLYPFIIWANSLQIDEKGIYIAQNGVRWICPYSDCRAINDDISNAVCQSCGRSR